MSDGLMAQLATSFLGAGTDALKEETDTVLGNVDQATREADNLVAKRIAEESEIYKADRNANLASLTSRRDNFDRLLRKYGPGQVEELDILEKSFPVSIDQENNELRPKTKNKNIKLIEKNTTDTIKIKLIFLRCENCNLRH